MSETPSLADQDPTPAPTPPARVAESPQATRITVVGPGGRADLAVPSSVTVAHLLPQLTRFVVRDDDLGHEEPNSLAPASWVLQRLGEKAMDPAGTPDSLEWLDGDVLHLRRAEDPLPELAYDDVAGGVAASVERLDNRWGGGAQRRTFTALAVAALLVGLALAVIDPSRLSGALTATGLTVLAGAAAVLLGRGGHPAQAGTAAVVASALAAAAGERFVGIPAAGPDAATLVVLAVPAAVVAGGLTGLRALAAPRLPLAPPAAVLFAALGSLGAAGLVLGAGASPEQAVVVISTLTLLVLLGAPRLAVRIARITSPQLPRVNGELRIDVEPAEAERLARRTRLADSCLSAFAVGGAVLLIGSGEVLAASAGWRGPLFAVVLALLTLLRSREFGAVAQRVALVSVGTAVLAVTVLHAFPDWPTGARLAALSAAAGAAAALGLAALRPLHRRLLPIWRYSSNIAEALLAVGLVPLALHVLGVFAWARGLAG